MEYNQYPQVYDPHLFGPNGEPLSQPTQMLLSDTAMSNDAMRTQTYQLEAQWTSQQVFYPSHGAQYGPRLGMSGCPRQDRHFCDPQYCDRWITRPLQGWTVQQQRGAGDSYKMEVLGMLHPRHSAMVDQQQTEFQINAVSYSQHNFHQDYLPSYSPTGTSWSEHPPYSQSHGNNGLNIADLVVHPQYNLMEGKNPLEAPYKPGPSPKGKRKASFPQPEDVVIDLTKEPLGKKKKKKKKPQRGVTGAVRRLAQRSEQPSVGQLSREEISTGTSASPQVSLAQAASSKVFVAQGAAVQAAATGVTAASSYAAGAKRSTMSSHSEPSTVALSPSPVHCLERIYTVHDLDSETRGFIRSHRRIERSLKRYFSGRELSLSSRPNDITA